jgi:hypothetical protein
VASLTTSKQLRKGQTNAGSNAESHVILMALLTVKTIDHCFYRLANAAKPPYNGQEK